MTDGLKSIRYVYVGDHNKTRVVNDEKPAALVTIDENNHQSDINPGKPMSINLSRIMVWLISPITIHVSYIYQSQTADLVFL